MSIDDFLFIVLFWAVIFLFFGLPGVILLGIFGLIETRSLNPFK